jgi:ketosteroid isomerase-like protein
MRWRLLLLAGLLAGCHAAGTTTTGPTGSPESALKAWSDSFLTGSVDSVAACYGPEEDVVLIHSTGASQRGIDAIRKEYEAAFDEVTFEKTAYQPTGLWQEGDVAWATGRFTAGTCRKADRSHWILEIQTSFVLRAVDGAWKIALEHSTPLEGVPRIRPADAPSPSRNPASSKTGA